MSRRRYNVPPPPPPRYPASVPRFVRFQPDLPPAVRMLPNYPDTDPFLVGVINRDGSQQALSEPETNSIVDEVDKMFITESVRNRDGVHVDVGSHCGTP